MPTLENFGGLEHGVEIMGKPHVSRINDHKVSFEVVFTAERIVFMIDRHHRRCPVRNIENACIRNAALDETGCHAATDGDHSIAALQCLAGKQAQQSNEWLPLRQDTQFLCNLGIEILRPMNDLVPLEKTNHRPKHGKHGRICHGCYKIRARQKQSAGEQPRDHNKITRGTQDHAATRKRCASAMDVNAPPGCHLWFAGFARCQNGNFPSPRGEGLGDVAEHLSRRTGCGGIDAIDEEDGWHGISDRWTGRF